MLTKIGPFKVNSHAICTKYPADFEFDGQGDKPMAKCAENNIPNA